MSQVELADELFRAGKFADARAVYKTLVETYPKDGEFQFKLACSAWRCEHFDEVEPHLLKAIELSPRNAAVQEAMALWLIRRGDAPQALEHSQRAIEMAPEGMAYISTHAECLAGNNREQDAWELIAPMIAKGQATVWLAKTLSKIAPKVGQSEYAASFLRQMVSIPNMAPEDRARLHFAFSELLERMGRYDEAFGHARLANSSNKRNFDVELYDRSLSRRINFLNEHTLRYLPRASHGNKRPVFIVGMPRSGTSLVEQILASHPDVFGAGELTTINEMIQSAAKAPWSGGKLFPECIENLSVLQMNRLAQNYLDVITRLNSTARYVTDKMPMNFVFLGTIQLMFPDCRVIHCIRDPRDTCLSCYFTDFGATNDFSHSISSIATVYRGYVRLMEHYRKVLSLPMLDVVYEDVVADPEASTRRMLKFLDLPWNDACMKFHENRRPVVTASRDQVRKPLYKSSIGRWKHFEKHIHQFLDLPTIKPLETANV